MRGHRIRRRDFITHLGGAVAWPAAARAQQQPALPVIGFLDSRSSDGMTSRLDSFRRGLKEAGLVEGENVRIEYRWAENKLDRLPEMVAELARRKVAVIATTGGPLTARAAKEASTTIPVVFLVGEDPTRLGLVSSLARPGGNLTGINFFSNELEGKRLGLLHQMIPRARRVAILVNALDARNTENTLHEVEPAARTLGLQTRVLKAGTAREIADAFAAMEQERPDALFVGSSAFLHARRVQLVQLATFHRLPAIYGFREHPEIGGLMSYGPSILDGYRQWGAYTGRVLKGVKPADLPVMQASRFELVVNSETARMLGIEVPAALLALADEVIE